MTSKFGIKQHIKIFSLLQSTTITTTRETRNSEFTATVLHWHQQQRPAWFSRAFSVPYLLTMPRLHKGLQSQLVGRIPISQCFIWKTGDMLQTGQLLKAAESLWVYCLKYLNKLLVSDPIISPQYSQWEHRVWICCSLSGHSSGLAGCAFWQPFNFGRQNSSGPDSQKKK